MISSLWMLTRQSYLLSTLAPYRWALSVLSSKHLILHLHRSSNFPENRAQARYQEDARSPDVTVPTSKSRKMAQMRSLLAIQKRSHPKYIGHRSASPLSRLHHQCQIQELGRQRDEWTCLPSRSSDLYDVATTRPIKRTATRQISARRGPEHCSPTPPEWFRSSNFLRPLT